MNPTPKNLVLISERETINNYKYSPKPLNDSGQPAYLVKQTTPLGTVTHLTLYRDPGLVPGHTWEAPGARVTFQYEIIRKLTIYPEDLVPGQKYSTPSGLGGSFSVEYVGPSKHYHVFNNVSPGWESAGPYYIEPERIHLQIYPL